MPGWGKLVAGVVIGAAGTIYATNKKVRERLPQTARDFPEAVRSRFETAVAAAREAAAERQAEIERGLEHHRGGDHASRGVRPGPEEREQPNESN